MERLTPDFVLSGRYRLTSRIAAGGMGEVWAAQDEVLQRRVAIKVMHPHTKDEFVFAERFRDEARHAAQLQSPFIVAVHDYGEHDGLAYLVMELVDGPTVGQRLRTQGPLAPDVVRGIMIDVASALVVAHANGIVHRDVKPANILIDPDGRAKLMDFGIARSAQGVSYTRTGEVLGTPEYISPEQAMGRAVTARSDVYSLGVVAHEMLTGVRPFARDTPVATALAHVNEAPPPLPPTVVDDLRLTIEGCLAKDPALRPSAEELVAELKGEAPVPAFVPPPVAVPPPAHLAATAVAGSEGTPATSRLVQPLPASAPGTTTVTSGPGPATVPPAKIEAVPRWARNPVLLIGVVVVLLVLMGIVLFWK